MKCHSSRWLKTKQSRITETRSSSGRAVLNRVAKLRLTEVSYKGLEKIWRYRLPWNLSWQRSLQCRRLQFNSWVRTIAWRGDRLPTPVVLGFPGGSAGREPTCNAGGSGFDPWVGKIPWRRAWQPTPVFLPGESPWTEEPGELQSMGLLRVGHDSATKHTWGLGKQIW